MNLPISNITSGLVNFNFSEFLAYPSTDYIIPLGIISFGVLFLLFLGLSTYFARLLSKASHFDEEREGEYKEASKVLREAKEEAFQIIEDATKRAEGILGEANALSDQLSSQIDTQMQNITQERKEIFYETSDNLLKANRKVLLEASNQNLKAIREVSKEFKDEMTNELKEFRKNLEGALQQSRKEMEQNLEMYKEAQKEHINDAITRTVQRAARTILGKAIDLQEHEEFVLKTLEDAKNSGLFNK